MEEFRLADNEVQNGRKNYIIILLKDNLSINQLPIEMKPYIRSHSYIDATKNTDLAMKRLRYYFCIIL